MESTFPPPPEERLEEALERVLAALPEATGKRRAFLLQRAGDVCVGLDDRRKALGWYGRAVDQNLQLGDPEQAALLCRLILHVQPDAVRARCTLTWIDLGTGQHAEAEENLAHYVESARKAGQNEMAAQQLGWMFAATPDPAIRERVIAGLRALGQPARADALVAELAGAHPSSTPGHAELWQRVLAATVGPTAAPPGR